MKKKEEVPEKALLGRPGNTLKMGIVGLPNVGKSSMFNLLSKLQTPAKNFMFCTIEPSKAKVEVPDNRFEHLCTVYNPKSRVPASLTIVDIAGLVKGASENQGMGNEFLSNIQSVDGIFHVVRAFDDEEVLHFEGDVDPVRDLQTIQDELMAKDLQQINRSLEELEKVIKRSNDKDSIGERDTLLKVKEMYKEGKNVRDNPDWNYKEIDWLNKHLFFTSKPMVYVVNLSENDFIRKKNKYLVKIKKWIDEHGGGKIIPISVAYEEKLNAMSQEERDKLIAENKAESALAKLITAGYYELDLIHFFTGGPDEVRCWTVRKGSKAPKAAGVIHTDFERGFISAEVMKYEDLQKLGNENEVKKAGLVRTEGKNYHVVDGDIIYFKFNVSDPGKKKK
jgi:obg-like ATPase 1